MADRTRLTRYSRLQTLVLGVVAAAAPVCAAESDDRWIEVESPHFSVVSNGADEAARQVAQDLERARAAARVAFPGMDVEPVQPVSVFAVDGEDAFRQLAPQFWERRGARPVGLFQQGTHRHHIIVRLDVPRDTRYSLVFHEYFHLLTSQNLPWAPTWLDEGLSEFWGGVVIEDDVVEVGRPAPHHLLHLRRGQGPPVTQLLSISRDRHDRDRANSAVFYAKAWALTHYIFVGDASGEARRATFGYLDLIRRGEKPLEAAARAFGDLDELERTLAAYVRSERLSFLRLNVPTAADGQLAPVRVLTPAESLSRRGTALVEGERPEQATPLLVAALALAPDQPLAHESLGRLQYLQNRPEDAAAWFTRAVALDDGRYLSHFYLALLRRAPDGTRDSQTDEELRRTIELNPSFAPAYARLAYRRGLEHDGLTEAVRLARRAAQLEPGNGAYWISLGELLARRDHMTEARAAGRNGQLVARTPEVRALASAFLDELGPRR